MRSLEDAVTLLDLLEIGSSQKLALVIPGGPVISYDSMRSQVHSLTRQLNLMGLGRGQRIGLVLPNGVEAIISFLAASAVATAAPLNPAYTEEEFRFYLEDTGADALITLPSGGVEAKKASPKGTLLIEANLDHLGRVTFSSEGKSRHSFSRSTLGAEDIALVLHTSGTTSRPKRVPLTHGNLTASVVTIVKTYELGEEDVSLCVMPLFHVHGLVASLLATLGSGGTVVVPPRFDALAFWSLINAHRVTWYSAVPSMHQALLARARRREPDFRFHQTLRFIRSCSSPLPAAVMHQMEEIFEVPMLEAYGMTEASHQMASNPLPPGKRKAGTVGTSTGVALAVMGNKGDILKPGSPGEVVIRGLGVIEGYEENPEANASSFINGWFRTGDEGHLDEEGYLTLTGRIKELINRAGEKISPLEIDEVLLAHPSVLEAVAFGVPSERYGEEVSAAVVLSGETTQADLLAHCRAHLASFKCPRIIHIVSEIPKTASGKVQRRIVASHLAGKGSASSEA